VLADARKRKSPPRARPAQEVLPRPTQSSAREEEPSLRLELAGGKLGLELAQPIRVTAGLELSELAFSLPDLRFPVDLSGGVRKFRHMRGLLHRAQVELVLPETAARLTPMLPRTLLPKPAELTLAARLDGLLVAVRWPEGALAFDLIVAPLGARLRLVVEEARGLGLSEAPHTCALRLVSALLPASAMRKGSLFTLEDPMRQLMLEVLPGAGARVPSTEGLRLGFSVSPRSGRVVIASEDPPGPLSTRAVRALETAQLLEEADDLCFKGQRDLGRAAYLAALERAPRHLDATRRLANIDLQEDRVEAAIGSIIEVENLVSAGVLGAVALLRSGEDQAAYAAFARAGAEEPSAGLAALAWFQAAQVAIDRKSRAAALDEAVLRWPMLAQARWQRLRERLLIGDDRGARADFEHLEANARTREERCRVAREAGELFAERGFIDQAEKLFERAIRFEPRDPVAVAGLARALRERGKLARSLDLFSRAISLATELGQDLSEVELELAEALVAYAQDRPNAIARVANISNERECAGKARLSEARWRHELGDTAGAARALGRLRALAEMNVPEPTGAHQPPTQATLSLCEVLLAASHFEQEVLGDGRAASRTLYLLLRLSPSHREASRRLASLRSAQAEPAMEQPQPRVVQVAQAPLPPSVAEPELVDLAQPEIVDEQQAAQQPPLDPALAEERVEVLSQRLRADPRDQATAEELGELLELLGRDLELLALLSARVEDADEDQVPELHQARRLVLLRLAEKTRAEGREDEAQLYESMAEG
jgi:tetratricopeptide (TPR) repeat protein